MPNAVQPAGGKDLSEVPLSTTLWRTQKGYRSAPLCHHLLPTLCMYLPPAGGINWTLDGIEGYEAPDTSTYCSNKVAVPDLAALVVNQSQGTTRASVAVRATDYKKDDVKNRRFIKGGGLKQLADVRFITVHTNEYMSTGCTGCPSMAEPMPAPQSSKGKKPQKGAAALVVDNAAACLYRWLFGLR